MQGEADLSFYRLQEENHKLNARVSELREQFEDETVELAEQIEWTYDVKEGHADPADSPYDGESYHWVDAQPSFARLSKLASHSN